MNSDFAIYGHHADRVLAGTLLRYALKKIMKIIVVIAGLFFAALGYLEYPQFCLGSSMKRKEADRG